jgi:hypothetical protein
LSWGPPSPAVSPTSLHSVEVEGAAFRITLSDVHVLDQEELAGIRLMIGDGSGQQRTIRIDAVEHDSKDPTGEIVLYTLSEQDPLSGEWRNLCEADPDGATPRLPACGRFHRSRAAHRDARTIFDYPAPGRQRENASDLATSRGGRAPMAPRFSRITRLV